MDGHGVAALGGRPGARSDHFNFHTEQDENKALPVKDNSSSAITIHSAVLRDRGARSVSKSLKWKVHREDEVLVRLVASGICHTDIDFCDSGGVGPAVLGHEGAGVVERLGKSAKGVRVGDHVVLSCASSRRPYARYLGK